MTTAPATRLSTTDMARVAVFAGVIAVLGLPGGLSVFGGVPITAQTLGVMLAGAILGPRLGALAVTVLLALVAAGLPLLSGGHGGAAAFVGPSGGYLIGWVLGAFVIGAIVHAGGLKPGWWRTATGLVIGGIACIYAVGIPVQSAVTHLPLGKTAVASLAFLPGDAVKTIIATLVVGTLVRAYPRAFGRTWAAPADARPTALPVR
jgi:biotin transport system substrate-specific component